jgi:DNA-binding response OmpR family regulator
MQTRILLVDDDAELRDALAEQLALHQEFAISVAETGAKGVAAAKRPASSCARTASRGR